MAISFNPFATTNQQGSFSVQSNGYIQGTAMADPAVRYQLAGGNYATGQTLPMFGGVAISESINASSVLGGNLAYATTQANLTGFSVFDQSFSWVNTPSSPVPTASPGQTVSFYRLGSNARIAVDVDPSLISLSGGLVTQQVSWDFNNQCLAPYQASTGTVTISTMTATTVGTVCTIAVVTAAASNVGAVGNLINISGATNSGTGGNSVVNGNFVVTSFTDNQHFSFQVPVSGSGVIATIAGSPVLNQGGGALNVKVLDLQVGNSMVVVYNPATGNVTWNKQGSCALIQI